LPLRQGNSKDTFESNLSSDLTSRSKRQPINQLKRKIDDITTPDIIETLPDIEGVVYVQDIPKNKSFASSSSSKDKPSLNSKKRTNIHPLLFNDVEYTGYNELFVHMYQGDVNFSCRFRFKVERYVATVYVYENKESIRQANDIDELFVNFEGLRSIDDMFLFSLMGLLSRISQEKPGIFNILQLQSGDYHARNLPSQFSPNLLKRLLVDVKTLLKLEPTSSSDSLITFHYNTDDRIVMERLNFSEENGEGMNEEILYVKLKLYTDKFVNVHFHYDLDTEYLEVSIQYNVFRYAQDIRDMEGHTYDNPSRLSIGMFDIEMVYEAGIRELFRSVIRIMKRLNVEKIIFNFLDTYKQDYFQTMYADYKACIPMGLTVSMVEKRHFSQYKNIVTVNRGIVAVPPPPPLPKVKRPMVIDVGDDEDEDEDSEDEEEDNVGGNLITTAPPALPRLPSTDDNSTSASVVAPPTSASVQAASATIVNNVKAVPLEEITTTPLHPLEDKDRSDEEAPPTPPTPTSVEQDVEFSAHPPDIQPVNNSVTLPTSRQEGVESLSHQPDVDLSVPVISSIPLSVGISTGMGVESALRVPVISNEVVILSENGIVAVTSPPLLPVLDAPPEEITTGMGVESAAHPISITPEVPALLSSASSSGQVFLYPTLTLREGKVKRAIVSDDLSRIIMEYTEKGEMVNRKSIRLSISIEYVNEYNLIYIENTNDFNIDKMENDGYNFFFKIRRFTNDGLGLQPTLPSDEAELKRIVYEKIVTDISYIYLADSIAQNNLQVIFPNVGYIQIKSPISSNSAIRIHSIMNRQIKSLQAKPEHFMVQDATTHELGLDSYMTIIIPYNVTFFNAEDHPTSKDKVNVFAHVGLKKVRISYKFTYNKSSKTLTISPSTEADIVTFDEDNKTVTLNHPPLYYKVFLVMLVKILLKKETNWKHTQEKPINYVAISYNAQKRNQGLTDELEFIKTLLAYNGVQQLFSHTGVVIKYEVI
jgi:hypothetical protein